MTSADQARDDANSALAEAKDGAVNARELVMGNLARLAGQGDWTEQEINLAAVLMGKQSNAELPKAVATFVGEAKRAMHPAVRDDFANIVEVRNETWEAEELARSIDKRAPQPVKKAFARKYHLLITLLGEAAKNNWLTTVEEVTTFAQARDPDVDADKAMKSLTKLREQLATIAANFPDVDLTAAADMLAKVVTPKQLQDARDELLGVGQPATTKQTKQAKFTSPNARAVPTKPATVEEDEMADGASDILDGILEDVLHDSKTTHLAAA